MIRKIASILSISILSVFTINNTYAGQYDTCLKWVTDGIGVHCKSKPDKDIGAILFFKKISEIEWHYQSANAKYPFELNLNGPGVTDYGREACSKFCEKYSG